MSDCMRLPEVRELLLSGERKAALRLAARHARSLGPDRAVITRGWEALQRPDNYRQMGQDPDAHVAAAYAALEARYRKSAG
jgi:hypothetical protein